MKWRVLHSLRLLVDILALSDEDSYHVKLTVLASAPNVLERMLALVAFAQVESQLVLCRSYISEYVIVGLPLEKGVANGWVTIVGCIVQRSPLTVVLGIYISTCG